MNPNDPNYPPGLSPQLDPTITPQAAPNAPPPPGLFSTAVPGYVMGQHEARLQANDIAAGYVSAGLTGALEVSLRAGQLIGMHSEVAKMAADHAIKASESAELAQSRVLHARGLAFRRLQHSMGAATLDPMYYGRAGYRAAGFLGTAAEGIQLGLAPNAGRMARLGGMTARGGLYALRGAAAIGTGGASLLLQEAAIQSVGQIYEGHASRVRSATFANQTAGVSGVSFSQQEARGAGFEQMASGMGMEFEEFSGLGQMLAQGGTFQGVNNLQEFKAKLRSSLQQLKQIAEVTNSTLQEAGQIGLALRQQGFSNGQIPAAAAQAFGLGQSTGLGAGAFLQMGGAGAQYGAATNMGMARGSAMFQQALGGVEFAMQRGSFSPEMIQRLGGSSSSATMALMQGTMGQAGMLGTTVSQMMGFITKKGEGEYSTPTIDQEKLERLLNGNVTRQELAAVTQAQQVLGMSTSIQRAAMPQVNQMLHATLSAGTSSQEEYLRKAEMMGIPPDVAMLISQTEQNRGLTDASTRIAIGTNMAQQSIARSETSGSFVGRLFSGNLGIGSGAMRNLGEGINRGVQSAIDIIFPTERAAFQPSAVGRDIMRDVLSTSNNLDVDVQDMVLRGSGSGNPFRKGAGEALREARYREFESVFSRAPGTGGATTTDDGIFGETTFTRRVVSRDMIDELVSERRSFTPTQVQVDRAIEAGIGNEMTTRSIMRNIGLHRMTSVAHRRSREEYATISLAEEFGLITPQEMSSLKQKLNAGVTTLEDGVRLQELRGQVHETANAAGIDVQRHIGADITAASQFGMISPDSLIEEADSMIRDLNITGLDELLTGESAQGNIQMMSRLRSEIDTLVEGGVDRSTAIRRVIGRSGLSGDQYQAARSYASRGFEGLDEIRGRYAAAEYRRVVDPIAAGIARRAERAFSGAAEGTFGHTAFTNLSEFGDIGSDPATRTVLMQDLLLKGLEDNDSLLNEADTLIENNLDDVARLFNTVEVLASGDRERIEALGFNPDDFLDEQGNALPKAGIVGALGESEKGRGILSGISGAQAQAAAGQSLEGRSMAGDLLAFSNNVKDLTAIINNMRTELGMTQSGGSGETVEETAEDGLSVANPVRIGQSIGRAIGRFYQD